MAAIANWRTEPHRAIVADAFHRVEVAVARLAESSAIDAEGLLRQAYELRWRDPIPEDLLQHISDLNQAQRLLLAMGRPPRAKVLSAYIDLARNIEARLLALPASA